MNDNSQFSQFSRSNQSPVGTSGDEYPSIPIAKKIIRNPFSRQKAKRDDRVDGELKVNTPFSEQNDDKTNEALKLINPEKFI